MICDNCGDSVPRLFRKQVAVNVDLSSASMGDTVDLDLCQVCAGVSDEDVFVDDSEINYRKAS